MGADARERLFALQAKRDTLAERNDELNRRVLAVLALGKRIADADAREDAGDAEKAYGEALNGAAETEEKHKHMAGEFARVVRDLQMRLDEKEAKAASIYETFRAFKSQVALQAVHSRTGKGIPREEVALFRDAEKEKDDEASRVRLRNINLRLMLRKAEGALRAKEQLAEGLHLVDFEQLKIENGTLAEKIEERTLELHKLRKKKQTSVETVSHVKAKLHFLRGAAATTGVRIGALDEGVGAGREALAKLKRERDALKRTNAGAKTDNGFTKSDRLVRDFEGRKRTLALLKDQIEEAKDKYANLAAYVEACGFA